MTFAAHASAILALLDADNNPPALVVLDGSVPQGTLPPYVLVYFDHADPELAESRPLTGSSQRHVTRAICHCVGGNQAASRAVAQRVRTALLDVVPTVSGRTCAPIRAEDSQPTRRDETTGALLMDTVLTYRSESVPSSPPRVRRALLPRRSADGGARSHRTHPRRHGQYRCGGGRVRHHLVHAARC